MKFKSKFLVIFLCMICYHPVEILSYSYENKLSLFIRDFLLNYNLQEPIIHDVVFLRVENKTSSDFFDQIIQEIPKDNPVMIFDLIKNKECLQTRKRSLVIIISDVYKQVSLSSKLKVKVIKLFI